MSLSQVITLEPAALVTNIIRVSKGNTHVNNPFHYKSSSQCVLELWKEKGIRSKGGGGEGGGEGKKIGGEWGVGNAGKGGQDNNGIATKSLKQTYQNLPKTFVTPCHRHTARLCHSAEPSQT